jgi:hypothetical protein
MFAGTKALAIVGMVVLAFLMSPGTNKTEAGPTAELELDFNISDGACVDIDNEAYIMVGDMVQVAACLSNPFNSVVGGFNFELTYNDTIVDAHEVADIGTALDDNPDANAGATTFASATYPTTLGIGWDCSAGVGAYPKGDSDGINGNGTGTAFSGGCINPAPSNAFTEGPLMVITFEALAPGEAPLTISNAVVYDEFASEIGSCNPVLGVSMICTAESINVRAPVDLTLDFDISDGACVDPTPAVNVTVGESVQVALCLENATGEDVDGFVFYLNYNNAIVSAPEVVDAGTALDDNPDANVGATTYTTPAFPDTLGSNWDCSSGGISFPQGDQGGGTAFAACNSAGFDGGTLEDGPLAVITFEALSPGISALSFSVAQVLINDVEFDIFECPDVENTFDLTCTGGTITVLEESDLSLDFDLSGGACVDIDPTATPTVGQSFDVAVCLNNPNSIEVDHFVFAVSYDDTIVNAPDIAAGGTALDDNPDANTGSTTYTSGTFPDTLGSGWDCAFVGEPDGDLDGVQGDGDGIAWAACNNAAYTGTLEDGPLAVITFDALAPGTSAFSFFSGAQVTYDGQELGQCPGTPPMTCTGGAVAVQSTESLKLDFNISDGACVDIDTAATVTIAQSLDVGVCLTNTTGNQISAFQYRVLYDDTIVKAPEEPDAGNGHDDNPNANVGTQTFTSATYPNHLGFDWNCTGGGVGAVPVGDLDGILANGNGQAYSGGCQSISGPHQLTSGPLGVVTLDAVGAGVAALTLEAVTVTDENLVQIGSCNPTDISAMTCSGGTITVQQGNGTITGKVYVNSVAPGNEFSGALVLANGAGNAVSDLAGNYSITGLPAGSYTLTANTQAPFTGASIGPVALGAGQTLSGQDIVITGPTGGVTGTAYRDSAIPANVMAGALVEACAAVCRNDITDSSGAYTVRDLPDGSYTLTLFPTGNYQQVSAYSVVVSGGTVASAPNLVAPPLVAPPPGTVEPALGNPLQPSVFSTEPFTLTRVVPGCFAAVASYTITQDTVIRSGFMTEGPAGTYTAVVAPLSGADPGQAIVEITIDCPVGPDPPILEFGIFIDPSGFVRDMAGAPIVGATVTLYRSENFYGPFIPVPNGNEQYMSAANRTNPGVTDANGHFRWDVASGFYKVEASKPGCLLPEAFKRSAFKRSEDVFETEVLPVPPPRTDLDLRLDCTPNPCDPGDPTIPNTDNAPIENGPRAPGVDVTIVNSDTNNDSCDTDDDNDGILDINEGGFPVPGCPSATAPLGSLQIDTDGDRLTDGWECSVGSDPASPASKIIGTGSADADGDRIFDVWEMRGYNGSTSSTDSDNDGCHDLVELASIDGNKTSGDSDRLAVARRALNVWGPEPEQDVVLDIDKNGTVNDSDRLFVARAVLLPAWVPKSCP